MATLVNGERMADIKEEWGVRWDDFGGDVCAFATEDEAEQVADETSGELVKRTVYITPWHEGV